MFCQMSGLIANLKIQKIIYVNTAKHGYFFPSSTDLNFFSFLQGDNHQVSTCTTKNIYRVITAPKSNTSRMFFIFSVAL